jgi:hypothetical protein
MQDETIQSKGTEKKSLETGMLKAAAAWYQERRKEREKEKKGWRHYEMEAGALLGSAYASHTP